MKMSHLAPVLPMLEGESTMSYVGRVARFHTGRSALSSSIQVCQDISHIQVPSPATQKSLGLEILHATGLHGRSERTRVWSSGSSFAIAYPCFGIVVLWIDEAHSSARTQCGRSTMIEAAGAGYVQESIRPSEAIEAIETSNPWV